MLKGKKPKHYTATELGVYAREIAKMRDSLYKENLIDRIEYVQLGRAFDVISATKVKIQFREQQKQGKLL